MTSDSSGPPVAASPAIAVATLVTVHALVHLLPHQACLEVAPQSCAGRRQFLELELAASIP